MPGLRWDLYCHVVDNLGDVGVCWRLAADLGARGDRVRLLIDDASALDFMAPGGTPGVTVCPWPAADPVAAPVVVQARADPNAADVVIEAFGCELPAAAIAAMHRQAAAHRAPVWINLEHLSAEPFVERCHGLPSPQPGGLRKWFYFPGFSAATGGLLREPGTAERHAAFDPQAWLAAQGCRRRPDERIVSLFCYANPALPALIRDLSSEPTLLLLTPGAAQQQVLAMPLADHDEQLRLHALPWLSQTDFDHLLWACDLNGVRGEDSLVRAIWAGSPFVWQAYPQQDAAHHDKVAALAGRLQLSPAVAAVWRAWNGMPDGPQPDSWPGLPPLPAWRDAAAAASRALHRMPDLASALRAFVATHAASGPGSGG